MTCKHLLNGAPDCVFCHRDQLKQENAELRRCLDGGTDCAEDKIRLRQENARLRKELFTAHADLCEGSACGCFCDDCKAFMTGGLI